MIAQFLSTQSRKAWVAGIITALLSPVVALLSGNGEITLRSALVAILSGIVAAVAVFGTTNDDELQVDDTGKHEA